MPATTDEPLLGPRFDQALAFASECHRLQVRRGTTIPYVSHLLAVAALVLEHGGSEDEAIAALLHDAVEDQGGRPTLDRIREQFGGKVADLVLALSDSIAEEGEPKRPWKERKLHYLAHLAQASHSVRLISAADKLHNLRALVEDLHREGETVWERFNAPRDCQLWFFRELYKILANADRTHIVDRLGDALLELEQAILPGGLAKAVAIAARVHAHQKDKAGAPYVLHPLRLMARAASEPAKIAAVLHDVLEDVDGWNPERLAREGFAREVIDAVKALTKQDGERYEDFIERVAGLPLAREVKLLDLEDNMDVTRLEDLKEKDLERLQKYHVSRRRLREA